MNNQTKQFNDFDPIAGEIEFEELATELMNLPRPTLSTEARARMLQRVQQAVPQPVSQQAPVSNNKIRVLRFPVQSALQLAASVAIFVVMLYQFGIPAFNTETSVTTVYPIQRSAEMQDVELISMYFS